MYTFTHLQEVVYFNKLSTCLQKVHFNFFRNNVNQLVCEIFPEIREFGWK